MKKEITVIGLGAGTIEQLPLGIYRFLLTNKHTLFARTAHHPVIESLKQEGIVFQSFDSVYEKHENFEEVYDEIVKTLLKEAEKEPIVYAVPGHPMLAEATVKKLIDMEKEDDSIKIMLRGGQSYLDSLFQALKIDPIEGFQLVDATSFHRFDLQYSQHIIFCQVYDEYIASEVKLTLMEDLPYDYEVFIVDAAGTNEEKVMASPLFELDRNLKMSNLMSVYIPPVPENLRNHQFNRLRQVIQKLRGPDGCPWDQKQTHESLKPYLIEEAYEVIDAINKQNDDMLLEELGDVLLQIMMHSQIGEEEGYFTIDDVIKSITDKMIRRHPHVFGEENVHNASEVEQNWEQIKIEEKGNKPSNTSLLDEIEKSLPNLLYAYELQKRAAKIGFDWDEVAPICDKILEEIEEFKDALTNNERNEIEGEFGDILFALVNLARHYKINPELALYETNEKFVRRFKSMEEQAKQSGISLKDLTLEEMDKLWDKAKQLEQKER
jgi:tetrapyrrole methylase family protein / MazG family protein